jgi:hypothetical protein
MFPSDEILFDEEPHLYRFRGRDYISVTQAIRLAGMGDDFSMVSEERMDYARRRGRMVHLACQYFDEGVLDLQSVDAAIRGYVEAYLKFREECKIKVIETEQKIVAERMGLAGTPDLIAWMSGRRVVIDRKTSQHMSKSMGLQTAGYKILREQVENTQLIYGRYGLRLEKTGNYKLFEHDNPEDEPAFRDALSHAISEKKMEKWRVQYGK